MFLLKTSIVFNSNIEILVFGIVYKENWLLAELSPVCWVTNIRANKSNSSTITREGNQICESHIWRAAFDYSLPANHQVNLQSTSSAQNQTEQSITCQTELALRCWHFNQNGAQRPAPVGVELEGLFTKIIQEMPTWFLDFSLWRNAGVT